MQSINLSYARYQFLKEKGIEIDESNYLKLFVNQSRFEKQYGITKEELLERYPYEEQGTEHEGTEIKSTQELGQETEIEQGDVETTDKISQKISERVKEKKSKEKNK